ncbi:flagellin [Silvanigrella aquatica]|uniref:Flagellin n=1 Tax=Silvanigrella aquatica TaxID=1915309 RepID=A0A1L4CZM4_9BACT|nr:flagellin [Silvanigrella aquatica]APJ03413.1 hypothetical protein AXG55_05630 [Silvanigrella aquatica]
MGIRIIGSGNLENNIAKAQKEYDNSLEKLSSGVRFTKSEPLPVERARSEALTSKMRELNVYKQNINEGLNVTQNAEASLNEASNAVIRMKELVAQAANSSLSDKERSFLFVEYQANYEDLVKTTGFEEKKEYQGIGRGAGKSTEPVKVRVGPTPPGGDPDANVVKIDNFRELKKTPVELGVQSAKELANSEDGVSIDDVIDHFGASSISELGKTFDNAHLEISSSRAIIGAATTRLNSALNSINVAYENTAAANSRIKDVDYATEITNLTKANILVQASSSLLAQRNNMTSQNILTLVKPPDKNS